MSPRWHELDQHVVERRYNRIAPFYSVFELLGLPPGLRRRAVGRLMLTRGDSVVEIGCGTGSNLALLAAAVGDTGTVFGVDRSAGMLAIARKRIHARQLSNCTIIRADAAEYPLPHRVDAAFFSLSYATMIHRTAALRYAWDAIKPGGRLVIFDSKPPTARIRRIVHAAMFRLSRASVLGNPDVRPWDDILALAPAIELSEHVGGWYFVLRAMKAG